MENQLTRGRPDTRRGIRRSYWKASTGRRSTQADWCMFFLGAAFMLLETKAVVQLAAPVRKYVARQLACVFYGPDFYSLSEPLRAEDSAHAADMALRGFAESLSRRDNHTNRCRYGAMNTRNSGELIHLHIEKLGR